MNLIKILFIIFQPLMQATLASSLSGIALTSKFVFNSQSKREFLGSIIGGIINICVFMIICNFAIRVEQFVGLPLPTIMYLLILDTLVALVIGHYYGTIFDDVIKEFNENWFKKIVFKLKKRKNIDKLPRTDFYVKIKINPCFFIVIGIL